MEVVSSDSDSVPKKAIKKRPFVTKPTSKPAAKSSKATSKVHYKKVLFERVTIIINTNFGNV